MAYTVISVFPATVDTEEIKSELKNQGFNDSDIVVSKSKVDDQSSLDDYAEDEKTKGFWNHLFVNENELLNAYSKKSLGNTNVVVYADNFEQAQQAKTLLNDKGAIEVYKKESETTDNNDTAGLPADVYNGIIAKAKHNLYFLDNERVYSATSKGMSDTMDDLGSKD